MNLNIIGTGSKGNAYILSNGDEALLIECGVNIIDIKKLVTTSVQMPNIEGNSMASDTKTTQISA